jgi:hypothetical protein
MPSLRPQLTNWFFAFLLLFNSTSASADPSGTYLYVMSSSILWLQIVQTPDGKVSGQMDTSTLLANGKIGYRSSEVKGSENGNVVTLQYDGGGVDLVRVSGTLNRDKLTLTGSNEDGPFTAEFTRAVLSDYKAELDALRTKSKVALAEQSNKNQATQLSTLMPRIAKFDATAETMLQKLQPVEGQYSDITNRMRTALDSEKVSTGVLRAQLGQRIANLRGDTDRIQGNVASVEGQYNGDVEKLKGEIDQSESTVRTILSQCVFSQRNLYSRFTNITKTLE